MSDAARPAVWSIAAHRGFADALAAGLIPRYAEADLGLARLTLLLPSRRAVRTVTEAFVRLSGAGGRAGLLLPRMVAVGDLDVDEALGPLLDPLPDGLGASGGVPPAADPTRRWLRLADHLRTVLGAEAPAGAALLRRARGVARTMDRLLVEGVAPIDLLAEEIVGLVGEQAAHWQQATRTFLMVQQHWLAELSARGEVDPPTRRNLLFDAAAAAWRAAPPPGPVIAAGVTSGSPALARLLRVVAGLPASGVVLPDLDLALDADVWDGLGVAGKPAEPGQPAFGRDDAATHPQYHLKLLLNRMGIARDEVRAWHRAGLAASPPARARAISNLFLPAAASAAWAGLADERRRLAGVRLMESAHPGAEAQAIAILMREALEVPERRVALVTPDRALAARVIAHLRRWGIEADDSAGRPLPQTAAGRLLLLGAEVMAELAAPVPLVALLGHPLVRADERRPGWLDQVREFDLMLRGPRPAPGLAELTVLVASHATEARRPLLMAWWDEAQAALAGLFAGPHDEHADADTDGPPLAELLVRLVATLEALAGDGLWSGADGRALAGFVDDLREGAAEVGTRLPIRELPALLREAMDAVAVRPPWGGHPRVAIYGLIEARMTRADLVICGGLTEGTWPGVPATDPLLPPAILRALGVPGADFRIGLSAHDLAGAMGAPEVVLSWARRDAAGPVIPSRFVLRARAMLGPGLADTHREEGAPALAAAIDARDRAEPHPRPRPSPSAEQRRVDISATGLDRLRSDPYQFYASSILRLSALDALDAEPSVRLRGEAAHRVLERWHREGGGHAGLTAIAGQELDKLSAHPLMRALWRPRLLAALGWVGDEVERLAADGREVIAPELWGEMDMAGVRVHGRIDRIDRLADGTLAIVDYKMGTPPSAARVAEGFTLQLGTLGLIARDGQFRDKARDLTVSGEPTRFEYWSLARAKGGDDAFGYRDEPILEGRKKTGVPREDFLPLAAKYLRDAIETWITGDEPFTARLNPDLASYNDYDHLMRLEEWFWTIGDDAGDAAGATP